MTGTNWGSKGKQMTPEEFRARASGDVPKLEPAWLVRLVKAEAWDEGYNWGRADEIHERDETRNPYRSAQ